MSSPSTNPDQEFNSKYFTELMKTLPKQELGNPSTLVLYQYKGYWYLPDVLEGVILLEKQFEALPTDILISGAPKTGNTWIKALCYAIAARKCFDHGLAETPLLNHLSHELVPFIEYEILKNPIGRRNSEHSLLSTHLPYNALPPSILSLGCKIIYICREPKDQFTSDWHFVSKILESIRDGSAASGSKTESKKSYFPIEEAIELFCQGKLAWGPYWDHVLDYWKANINNPDNVLFLKYEELKKDAVFYVKKLADFMNKPFSPEEEMQRFPEKIVDLCSFERLRDLEVSKTGKHLGVANRDSFYRRGEAGDWKKYLSEKMAERIDRITEEKLEGCNFKFGTIE